MEKEEYSSTNKEKFPQEQAKDWYCKLLPYFVEQKVMQFELDHEGYLVNLSTLDALLPNVVPELLCQSFLQQAHRPRFAGHSGGTRMHYTLRRCFYWPLLAHEVYIYVARCTSCLETCGGIWNHEKFMRLLSVVEPSKFVAMDLLGSLSETIQK